MALLPDRSSLWAATVIGEGIFLENHIHAMNIVITSEVLQAYSLCPRKAFLLLYGNQRGTPHEYEQILIEKQLQNQAINLELLKQKQNDVYPYSVSNLEKRFKYLIDANLTTNHFQTYCAILTKVDNLIYEPTIFIGTHTIKNTDKLSLLFAGYVLAKIQGRLPEKGYIVNMKGKSRRLQGKRILIDERIEARHLGSQKCPSLQSHHRHY